MARTKATKAAEMDLRDLPMKDTLGFMLRDVGRGIGRQLGARIEAYGISVAMWFVIRLLAEEEGITQRELSYRLGVIESTAMETLRELETRGLIVRTRSPVDRRKILLALSAEGKELLHRMTHVPFEMRDLIERCGSPEELAMLRKLLGRLQEILADPPVGPSRS